MFIGTFMCLPAYMTVKGINDIWGGILNKKEIKYLYEIYQRKS